MKGFQSSNHYKHTPDDGNPSPTGGTYSFGPIKLPGPYAVRFHMHPDTLKQLRDRFDTDDHGRPIGGFWGLEIRADESVPARLYDVELDDGTRQRRRLDTNE